MIKYPNKKETFVTKKTNHSNRGMVFENMINDTNEYYLAYNKAVIHKKPIPVQIVKVDYKSRATAVIKEAYYKVPSTTDYNGIYLGYYIDFEAKETLNQTSFPISNIHAHQVEHLISIKNHGGIAFILVYFKKLDKIYLLDAEYVDFYYKRSMLGRKSITINEFEENGHIVQEGLNPRVAYLDVVKDLYIKSKSNSQK